MSLPAEKTRMCLLSTVKHGGGSVIALAAVSWDSLGLTITPHSGVMPRCMRQFYRTTVAAPRVAAVL